MRRILYPITFVLAGVLAVMAAENSPRSMQILDTLAWKHIQSQVVSTGGQWLAYRLVPNEGDSEVVVRNLSNATDSGSPPEQPRAKGPRFPGMPNGLRFSVSHREGRESA